MRLFLSMVQQFIVLIIVSLIVCAVTDSERYDAKSKTRTKQTITIGSAMEVVEDGKKCTAKDLGQYTADMYQYLLGGEGISPEKPTEFFSSSNIVAKAIIGFSNIKIGYRMARFFENYYSSGFLTGLLCCLLGIGMPFSWLRENSLSDAIEDRVISKDWVYVRGGQVVGRPGENLGCFLTLLLWAVEFLFASVWGVLILFIFILGLLLLAISFLLRSVLFWIKELIYYLKRKARSKNTDTPSYSLLAEGKYFKVANDSNSDEALYFNRYYNALIAERIMNLDSKGEDFSLEDAEKYITYGGDEKMFYHFMYSRFLHTLFIKLSKKHTLDKMMKKHDSGSYNAIVDNGRYRVVLNDADICVYLQKEINLFLLYFLLKKDSKKEDYESIDWIRFNQIGDEEKKALDQFIIGIDVR